MKKIFCLFFALVTMFSLCACGNTPAVESTSSNESFKAGLICLHDENSTYDLNFITAFKAACDAKGAEAVIKTGIGESGDCYDAAAQLADIGCKFVFADSFGHEDYMIGAAQDFPEVEFCHATGTQAHTLDLPNFHNAFAAIYEGRYLDGIAIGMKLNEMIANGEITKDEARIGYVGAMQYAEVISGYTSFFLGARSVCPSATMLVTFTGTWYDETFEKEAANALIGRGCVVISGHADSMGSPSACENLGVPFAFYNGSIMSTCPNTFIVSTKINWQPYFEMVIDCIRNGESIPDDWTGTIETGSVVMTEVNEAVAAEGTADAILKGIEDFKAGAIKVFDTSKFTVNGKTIDSYLADVDSDANYEADTEAISDGYFHESEYRSAPYFDMLIDGIELMT